MKDPLFIGEVFTKWQAWCDLIMSAYYAPSEFFIRGIKTKAKRGCVYKSTTELAERWQWSRGKVSRFFTYLVKDGRITIQRSNVINCITILNYEKYQQNEPTNRTTNEPTNEPTNRTTHKKVKKDNILFPESQNCNSGDGIIQSILSQMQELKERLDAQEQQSEKKPKKKKEVNPLITKGREVFEKKYSDLYGDIYYWQAKDAVAMDALTKKIIFSRQQKGMSTEQDEVIKALEVFLSSVCDEWLVKNYSVPNINSKYNEIVAHARACLSNGKTDRQTGTSKRRFSEVTATSPEEYEGAF